MRGIIDVDALGNHYVKSRTVVTVQRFHGMSIEGTTTAKNNNGYRASMENTGNSQGREEDRRTGCVKKNAEKKAGKEHRKEDDCDNGNEVMRSDRSDVSGSGEERSDDGSMPDGHFALSKTEASSFQNAIKSYTETCIETEQLCRDINTRIYVVEGSVKASNIECGNLMA